MDDTKFDSRIKTRTYEGVHLWTGFYWGKGCRDIFMRRMMIILICS